MQTLDDYLGFTFTQNMVCARHKDRLAWIQTTKGIRNVYTAIAPGFDPVQVTAWRDDDGQVLSGLKISDDGQYLLFIRGEGKNELGEYPNPMALNYPPRQTLWLINLARRDSSLREVAESGLACFRSCSSEIYFGNKGKLFRADCNTPEDQPLTPEQVLETRGRITALSWSEQGDRLALSVRRYRHGFIGVHTPEKDSIDWLSPGFDRDVEPSWSPDGQQIAFLRCQGVEPDIADMWFSDFSDRFEVMVANIEFMKARSYWQCPEGSGLSVQEGSRPISWVNDTQLLFSHEATGWNHIYRLDLDRRKVETLTKGEFIVHSYATDRHSGWLYYTHNDNKKHGYSLARLNLNNGTTENLQTMLPPQSIPYSPVPVASGNAIGLILGGARQPLIPALLRASSHHLSCFGQPAYEAGCRDFVPVEEVSVSSGDDLEIPGQLFRPEGNGPFPAILTLHGGPWCQTLAGFNNIPGLSYVYACCQYLASKGFLVLSLNYRGSSGYGKSFRQPGPYCWNGACEYQDVVAAGQWLARRKDVDKARVGLWGKSYGGHLTAMGLARNSDLFKAGVDIEGCHHFPREFRQKHWGSENFSCLAGEDIVEVQERCRIALESSAWYYLDSWKSPVLLIHPDDDRTVQFEEAQRLYYELKKRGVEVEGMAIPDEVHSFLRHSVWVESHQKSVDFFKRRLKP